MTSPNVISLFRNSSEDLPSDTKSRDNSTYLHKPMTRPPITHNVNYLKDLVESYARDLFSNQPLVQIYSSSMYSYGRLKNKVSTI